MNIPKEAQPHVAALVRRNQYLERKVEDLTTKLEAAKEIARRRTEAQRERADKEQRLAQQAWREAERLFG